MSTPKICPSDYPFAGTPTATPRTQALWMKHHAFSTEEEATEALCDFRDHGNALEAELACEKENRNHLIEKGAKLETELAAAKAECKRIKVIATEQNDIAEQHRRELARLRADNEQLKADVTRETTVRCHNTH